MKIYSIFPVPAQILYLGKIGQNALSESYCKIFKSTLSPEQINETVSFLYIDINSQKLKGDKIFLVGHG